MLTEGPAIECLECGHIEIGDDPDAPCPPCEERGSEDPFCTQAVVLSLCDVEPGGECEDPTHHWGLQPPMHVKPPA